MPAAPGDAADHEVIAGCDAVMAVAELAGMYPQAGQENGTRTSGIKRIADSMPGRTGTAAVKAVAA